MLNGSVLPGLADRVTCACCGADEQTSRCLRCGAAISAGEFRVEQLIAQGVHGRMYQAASADGRKVALKELVFALAPDAQSIDAFEREAALLRSLEHPAVPRFVASFREGKGPALRLYLAQELIEGQTLLARLQRRRLDEKEARDVAIQLLAILGDLHERTPRLLHRDIKPANILIRPNGELALVDFGTARATEKGATHGATVLGTFGYAAPEQFGGTADERSDLYSLGATLIHCVTGIPPAELLTPSLAIDFSRHVEASPAFVRFLAALVRPRREDRPANAQQANLLLHDDAAPLRKREVAFDRLQLTSLDRVSLALERAIPLPPVMAWIERARHSLVVAAFLVGICIGLGSYDYLHYGFEWTHDLLPARASKSHAPAPVVPNGIVFKTTPKFPDVAPNKVAPNGQHFAAPVPTKDRRPPHVHL